MLKNIIKNWRQKNKFTGEIKEIPIEQMSDTHLQKALWITQMRVLSLHNEMNRIDSNQSIQESLHKALRDEAMRRNKEKGTNIVDIDIKSPGVYGDFFENSYRTFDQEKS